MELLRRFLNYFFGDNSAVHDFQTMYKMEDISFYNIVHTDDSFENQDAQLLKKDK